MAWRKGLTMGIDHENYPGFEHDLNNGAPQTLGQLTSRIREGIALESAARYRMLDGNMGLGIDNREVFATVRGNPDASYWVTGVRLLPREEGARSLAGAIELILEDGDEAQTRALDAALQSRAEGLVHRLARFLAGLSTSGLSPTDELVDQFKPLARGILKASGPELNVEPTVARYL